MQIVARFLVRHGYDTRKEDHQAPIVLSTSHIGEWWEIRNEHDTYAIFLSIVFCVDATGIRITAIPTRDSKYLSLRANGP